MVHGDENELLRDSTLSWFSQLVSIWYTNVITNTTWRVSFVHLCACRHERAKKKKKKILAFCDTSDVWVVQQLRSHAWHTSGELCVFAVGGPVCIMTRTMGASTVRYQQHGAAGGRRAHESSLTRDMCMSEVWGGYRLFKSSVLCQGTDK